VDNNPRQKKIAVLQTNTVLDYEKNLLQLDDLIKQAKKWSKLIFLPECFYSISDGTKPTPFLVEEGNAHWKNIQKLATDNGVYLLAGSVAYRLYDRIINRNLNFDPSGKMIGLYDKIHLFSCDLANKKVINESDIYTPGSQTSMIEVEGIKIGLGICFDLRFPEMFREYVRKGAQLLTVSAAFTVPTGKAHWHTLLRARAIENQCFVVAPAQVGRHNDRIETYGHSLIVDPWGTVLADGLSEVGVVQATIDLDEIPRIRNMVKVF
jgi:predicted amidohydrolase